MSGSGMLSPPTLALMQTTATVSQSLTVTGTNFLSDAPVKLYWDSTATTPVVTATTTASGSFTTQLTVPQAVSGTHTILAEGQGSGQTATTTVSVVPAMRIIPNAGAAAHRCGFWAGALRPMKRSRSCGTRRGRSWARQRPTQWAPSVRVPP